MKNLLMLAVGLTISVAAMSQTVEKKVEPAKTEQKCAPKAGCAKEASCCAGAHGSASAEAKPAGNATLSNEKKTKKVAAATKEN